MIEGNDGGANVSFNGGRTWSTIMNQPTAQFYRVATDDQFPYRVYGAQQDNSTVAIASRTRGRGIDTNDWYPVGGGESGWIAPEAEEPDVVFAGSYGGIDHPLRPPDRPDAQRHGLAAARDRARREGPEVPLPVELPDPLLAARPEHALPRRQVLLRSRDEGQSWEVISPDLTRNDKAEAGVLRRPDHEGQHRRRVLRHDLHLRGVAARAGRPLGGHRRRPGPAHARRRQELAERDAEGDAGVDPGSTRIDVSPHDGGPPTSPRRCTSSTTSARTSTRPPTTARPGRRSSTASPTSFTRVIREDPDAARPALRRHRDRPLRLLRRRGTTGSRFQLNLPVVPITDLAVKDGDLVVATHGRSFWILDDLSPRARLQGRPRGRASPPLQAAPRRALSRGGFGGGDDEGSAGAAGQEPAAGRARNYCLKEKPGGEGAPDPRVSRRRQGAPDLHHREEATKGGGRRRRAGGASGGPGRTTRRNRSSRRRG